MLSVQKKLSSGSVGFQQASIEQFLEPRMVKKSVLIENK